MDIGAINKMIEVFREIQCWLNGDGEHDGVGDPSFEGIYTKKLQEGIDLAQSVVDIAGKMPQKGERDYLLEWGESPISEGTKEKYLVQQIRNQTIDDCTKSFAGCLLTKEEIRTLILNNCTAVNSAGEISLNINNAADAIYTKQQERVK